MPYISDPARSATAKLNWQSTRLGSVRASVERILQDPALAAHIPRGAELVAMLRAGEQALRAEAHDIMRRTGRESAIGERDRRGRGKRSPARNVPRHALSA